MQRTGKVNRIFLEGWECGGHLGFKSRDEFISTRDLIRGTWDLMTDKVASDILGKGAPAAERAALQQEISANPDAFRDKHNLPELTACGGINTANVREIVEAGAEGIGNALFFTITKESAAHDRWKELQFGPEPPVFIISSVKGMMASAVLNEFVARDYEQGEDGVYRLAMHRDKRNRMVAKTGWSDRCYTNCMRPECCQKYVPKIQHPQCVFHRLEESAVEGKLAEGIVFTSQNKYELARLAKLGLAYPNVPAIKMIEYMKGYARALKEQPALVGAKA